MSAIFGAGSHQDLFFICIRLAFFFPFNKNAAQLCHCIPALSQLETTRHAQEDDQRREEEQEKQKKVVKDNKVPDALPTGCCVKVIIVTQ